MDGGPAVGDVLWNRRQGYFRLPWVGRTFSRGSPRTMVQPMLIRSLACLPGCLPRPLRCRLRTLLQFQFVSAACCCHVAAVCSRPSLVRGRGEKSARATSERSLALVSTTAATVFLNTFTPKETNRVFSTSSCLKWYYGSNTTVMDTRRLRCASGIVWGLLGPCACESAALKGTTPPHVRG